jgi:hypothetical protein
VSKKNKSNKQSMFDIKPVERTDGFDFDSKFEIREDFSLADFLIQEEEKVLSQYQRIDLEEKQEKNKINEEIKKEIKSFRNVNLDNYFSDKEIPTKIIVKTDDRTKFFDNKIKRKKSLVNAHKKRQQLKERALILEEKTKQLNKTKEFLFCELNENREKGKNNKIELKRLFSESDNLSSQRSFIQDQIQLKKQNLIQIKKTDQQREREDKINKIKNNLLSKPFENNSSFNLFGSFLKFSGASLVIFLMIFGVRFFSYGFQVKEEVMVKGVNVVKDLDDIKNNFQDKDFNELISDFEKIQQDLNQINQDLNNVEGGLPNLIIKIPFISKYGSAKNFLEAGEEISKALVLVGGVAGEFSELKNPLNFENNEKKSMGQFFLNLEDKTREIESYLSKANNKIQEVNISDLPVDYQKEVKNLKEKFPQILSLLGDFNQKQFIFKDLLGYNGPRKYLFLFQNNQEIRATGGFIGSYGILDIHNGNVKDFFIDGIYNPDGQLYTKVVPPKPIQKISTAWSTHDANWFPNFPDSAQKIAWFYEKTGGPTVDGILTFTPTILEKLLEFTGPIEMSEYDLVINSENFIELTQTEVEVNYDKEDNKPKQIIADLTPKIVEKLFSEDSLSNFPRLVSILSDSLTEKHLLIYLQNSDIQEIVSDLGWSGEVLQSPKDYLMVVNSNINGYKTDGVVDQKVDHKIEIKEDGSLIDTVTIERIHNGGSTDYDWWNKVNANYMRVYVPLGSELLEAQGHTLETVESPVNYEKLGFIRDNLVENLENSIKIDQESQTEIWEEADKTVFGNWVYVSPQEKVKITYKYRLPFKLEINSEINKMDNYSVLYQKQSGMNTSELKSEIFLPNNREVFWQYPEDVQNDKNLLEYTTNLERDRFIGIVIK